MKYPKSIYQEDLSKEAIEDIDKWMTRTLNKGPFYLYEVHENAMANKLGHTYLVAFKTIVKGSYKTKMTTMSDNMHTRYGLGTMGVLTGTSVTGLWQSGPNSIDEDMLDFMMKIAKDEIKTLVVFDPLALKNITI